jgi:hypothetical protein
MIAPLQLDEILFGNVEEGRVDLASSEGEIPRELAGTYYLNARLTFVEETSPTGTG